MNDTQSPPSPQFLACEDGESIAYHALPGRTPGIVFFGGFLSDMTGTKAMSLETLCQQTGQAFVRFDYFGHGASSGAFTEGTISRWKADAVKILDEATQGPQILVGSSLGAWIMILAALERRERVAGMVSIAGAPDFTEDLIWEGLSEEDRKTLEETGSVGIPNPYGDEPTPVSRALIEDGRENLVLRGTIPLTCPVRLLHGLLDREVPPETSLKLATSLDSENVAVTFIKNGDHRLSNLESLSRVFLTVAELLNPPPQEVAAND
ncbi:MAG: alpha/beta hydrolase [Alphaproteobacteria bacterium]|nr:alpha/beta hydrolase [Alphaproteobacteria bacterium]